MLRSGQATFHGFGLAHTMREQSGSRALTGHGTLYKALEPARGVRSAHLPLGGRGGGRGTAAPATVRAHRAGSPRGRAGPCGPCRSRRRTSPTRRLGARMTPERMARLVARWVRLYTRNLPAPIARRRIDEIDADLHDHIAHERADGTRDWRIAVSVAGRMVRGLAADASWRGRMIAHPSTPKDVTKMSRAAFRSAVRVALATAFDPAGAPGGDADHRRSGLGAVRLRRSPEPSWQEPVCCSSWQRGGRATWPTGPPPPRSASPPSCSGRPMTRPASCSSAACSSLGTVALTVRTALHSE